MLLVYTFFPQQELTLTVAYRIYEKIRPERGHLLYSLFSAQTL